jgi:hypothetical protein
MDISGEVNGNSTEGWKEYWLQTVLDQLRLTNCDGIFADSYGLPWNLDFTPDWLIPPNDVAWIHHMELFGNHVTVGLGEGDERFYFIPNLGPWITTRDTCDYGAFVDGVMVEMFASPGPWDLYEMEDWELQMNRLLDLERRDRVVICQPITEDEWAVGERMYNLANYLLIKGEKTYYNLVFGENFYDRLIFFPEYLIDLGSYNGGIPSDIAQLYDQSIGLFTREYANGRVFVNPTWDEIAFDLDDDYYTIDLEDLCDNPLVDIEEDGVFRDSLSFVPISGRVTIGYKGGLILLETLPADPISIYVDSSRELFLVNSMPAPFSQFTSIAFEQQVCGPVGDLWVEISDVGGREVRSLMVPAPRHGLNHIIWDGRDDTGRPVASGSYFCLIRQQSGECSNCLQLVLRR